MDYENFDINHLSFGKAEIVENCIMIPILYNNEDEPLLSIEGPVIKMAKVRGSISNIESMMNLVYNKYTRFINIIDNIYNKSLQHLNSINYNNSYNNLNLLYPLSNSSYEEYYQFLSNIRDDPFDPNNYHNSDNNTNIIDRVTRTDIKLKSKCKYFLVGIPTYTIDYIIINPITNHSYINISLVNMDIIDIE